MSAWSAWTDAAEDVAILTVFVGAAFIAGQLAYRCRLRP